MPQLKVENLYNSTITEAGGIPASGDCDFTVAVAPLNTNGFIIISPENIISREIMYYHNVVGNRIYVRGVNRFSPKAHAVNDIIKINDVAEIFNTFSDMISQAFYVEKTGGFTIKVWGGYVYYNGAAVTVPDTNLTLVNGTNYVKYDYPTNTISSDLVSSGNIKAEVTVVAGIITSIVYTNTKESFIDFTVAITGALPSQSGNAGKVLVTDGTNVSWGSFRSGFGTDKHVRVNRTTGAEQSIAVTNGTIPLATDIIRVEKSSGGVYEDIPYDSIKSDILPVVTGIAGESLTATDAVTFERVNDFAPMATTQAPLEIFSMGDVAARNRLSMKVFGNGINFTTLNLYIAKVGAPTDNFIVTLETDTAGLPSGTPVTNGTVTVAGTTFTTTYTDTVFTFPGTVNLTNGTVYHIVVKRQNAFDGSNYYSFGVRTANTRFTTFNQYNASWGSPVLTKQLFLKCAGVYSSIVIKASGLYQSQSYVEGFSQAIYTLGQSVQIYKNLVTLSGLVAGTVYHLSDTAGAIQTNVGTTFVTVGYAISTTKLVVSPVFRNNSITNNQLLFDITLAATNTIRKKLLTVENGIITIVQTNVSSTSATISITANGVSILNVSPSTAGGTFSAQYKAGDVILIHITCAGAVTSQNQIYKSIPLTGVYDIT